LPHLLSNDSAAEVKTYPVRHRPGWAAAEGGRACSGHSSLIDLLASYSLT
jgi:hypothetical protein